MRRVAAVALAVVVVILGAAGAGSAQNFIQVNGVIQAYDCQTNALVLRAPDGVHVFPLAPNAAVYLNSTPLAFCALRQYVGSYAVASVGANEGQFFAARVDVFPSAAPPGAYPGPGYYPYYYGPPFGISIGIGFGFGFGDCCFHHWHH
jgi:hypothetical protein